MLNRDVSALWFILKPSVNCNPPFHCMSLHDLNEAIGLVTSEQRRIPSEVDDSHRSWLAHENVQNLIRKNGQLVSHCIALRLLAVMLVLLQESRFVPSVA